MSSSFSPAPEAGQEPEVHPFAYAEVAAQVGGLRKTAAAEVGESAFKTGEILAQREAAAREMGRQEGEAQGRAAGEPHLAQVRASVDAALAGFARDRAQYYQQVETEVVQLALAIARKILHREAQVDPMLLAGLVRITLEKIESATKVVVRVHPQQVRNAAAILPSTWRPARSRMWLKMPQYKKIIAYCKLRWARPKSVSTCNSRKSSKACSICSPKGRQAHERPGSAGAILQAAGVLFRLALERPSHAADRTASGIAGPFLLGGRALRNRECRWQGFSGRDCGLPRNHGSVHAPGAADGIRYGDRVVTWGTRPPLQRGPGAAGPGDRRHGRAARFLGFVRAANTPLLDAAAPLPLERDPIREPLGCGIRAMDAFLTCGRGQRVGIFGGSGVGKSTLIGHDGPRNRADMTVLALVGERGREVGSFSKMLWARKAGGVRWWWSPLPISRRCCASARRWPRPRSRNISASGARTCCWSSIRLRASPWRSAKSAWPPASRPPPKAIRPRCSTCWRGWWSARAIQRRAALPRFYTVLMEGDDQQDPMVDTVRSLLDGHVVLDRHWRAQDHYPPISILDSLSRLMPNVCSPSISPKRRRCGAAGGLPLRRPDPHRRLSERDRSGARPGG